MLVINSMGEYSFREGVVEFLKKVYGKFNPSYRMDRFEGMLSSGELEWMCASEFYKRFGIKRKSREI